MVDKRIWKSTQCNSFFFCFFQFQWIFIAKHIDRKQQLWTPLPEAGRWGMAVWNCMFLERGSISSHGRTPSATTLSASWGALWVVGRADRARCWLCRRLDTSHWDLFKNCEFPPVLPVCDLLITSKLCWRLDNCVESLQNKVSLAANWKDTGTVMWGGGSSLPCQTLTVDFLHGEDKAV